MTTEQNKSIVQKFYSEAINEGNLTVVGELLTEDFTHNGVRRGVAGQTEVIKIFLNAFQDLTNTIEICLSEGNLVAIHEKWTGIHSGEFMGVKGTGKAVQWTSNAILKIREDKIAEAWDENDFLGLFMQIGEFPSIK